MLTHKQILDIRTRLNAEDLVFPLMFQALGDTGRFKIFTVLARYHNICVTDIANILNISVSAASQQLRILERLGLVLKVRMGQMVCYEIKDKNPVVKQLLKLFN